MAFAQPRKVELTAVATGGAVCVELAALGEIAERADRNGLSADRYGLLARSVSIHGR
jgi:hypothetical protein